MKSAKATLLEHALVCDVCRGALERLLAKEDVVRHAIEQGVFPPMRPQIELQRAHDLLTEVLRDRPLCEKIFRQEGQQGQAMMALDSLCWCLGHTLMSDSGRPLGINFARLLIELEGALNAGGYLLREITEPRPPEPAAARKTSAPMEFEFGSEE
jgi:hypothetical protein